MNHSLTVFLGAQKVFFCGGEKHIKKNKNGKKFQLKVQLEVLLELELELDVQLEVSRFPQGIGERRKRTI